MKEAKEVKGEGEGGEGGGEVKEAKDEGQKLEGEGEKAKEADDTDSFNTLFTSSTRPLSSWPILEVGTREMVSTWTIGTLQQFFLGSGIFSLTHVTLRTIDNSESLFTIRRKRTSSTFKVATSGSIIIVHFFVVIAARFSRHFSVATSSGSSRFRTGRAKPVATWNTLKWRLETVRVEDTWASGATKKVAFSSTGFTFIIVGVFSTRRLS